MIRVVRLMAVEGEQLPLEGRVVSLLRAHESNTRGEWHLILLVETDE